MTRTKKIVVAIAAASSLFLFYLVCLNFTEPTELGIARNYITGKFWAQEGGGWHLTAPWTLVSVIDLRPMRVSVQSGGRGFHAKLVQFEPKQWELFVKTEGFRYWWWTNRLSFNSGHKEEHRGVKDIMRGYAYSAKKYPFITVIAEYHE